VSFSIHFISIFPLIRNFIVGLQERLNLTRRILGFPTGITVLITYSSTRPLPSESSLRDRVTELQHHFPLLYSEIRGIDTREPYFQQRSTLWDPSDILQRRDYQPAQDKSKVLLDELERSQKEDISVRPIWQISIYISGENRPAYLTVSVDHVLLDGMGLLFLIYALLSPDISHLPSDTLPTIPRMEDTIDTRPSYTYLIPIAWRELFLPKLPMFMQNYFKTPLSWPDDDFAIAPTKVPQGSSLLEIPYDIMDALKRVGKTHGISTLHPTMMTAYLVAMWAVLKPKREPLVLRGAMPRSERDSKLGHPYCSANYISHLSV